MATATTTPEIPETPVPTNYEIAKTKIKRYFDRPNANEMQCLNGTNLKNIIGFSLNNLPITLPINDAEQKHADNENFCYFTADDCQKAIEIVEMKMYEIAKSKSVELCVIPIVLIYENTIYELPIFRMGSQTKFIDNCGRYYYDWNDWMKNNKVFIIPLFIYMW